MKKLLAILLAAVMCISFCACGKNNEDSGSAYNSAVENNDADSELSDDTIESLVVSALYKEISSKYDTADPGSCTYEINKTEPSGRYTYVYGSVTLYDKYGKTTTGWIDGSGTAFRSFEIKISESGSVVSCEIS